MKRISLIMIIVLFPAFLFAEDSWYNQAKNKIVGDDAPTIVKTVTGDRMAGNRADWEFAVKAPFILTPDGGDMQTAFRITDIWIYHNMPKDFLGFFAMMKSVQDITKWKKKRSHYTNSWDYDVLCAGAHWYITRQQDYNIAFFGGAGQVKAKDGNGSKPNLGMAILYGIRLDIPYRDNDPFGWNFEISYETISAENKELDVEKSLGNFRLDSWMAGIRIPF